MRGNSNFGQNRNMRNGGRPFGLQNNNGRGNFHRGNQNRPFHRHNPKYFN